MTKRLKDEERVKKVYSPRGTQGQKMFNFRMDIENYEWLQRQDYKGRLLNRLIEKARRSE